MKKIIKLFLFLMVVSLLNFNSTTLAKNDNEKNSILTFQVFSDIHMEPNGIKNSYEYTVDAFKDLEFMNATNGYNNSINVFLGDNTQDGKEEEYVPFYKALSMLKPENTMPITGNHDVRKQPYEIAKKRFLKFNKSYMKNSDKEVYYDKWIKGYHFIALGSERNLDCHAEITTKQLNWLEEKIKENEDPNKPVFILLHQVLEDTYEQEITDLVSSPKLRLDTQNPEIEYKNNPIMPIYDADSKIKEILSRHPQSILFTGHMHNNEKTVTYVNKGWGTQVDCPPMKSGKGKAYQINIYNDNNVKIRIRDFKTKKWLDKYEMNFNFKAKSAIDKKDDVASSEVTIKDDTNKIFKYLTDYNNITVWQVNRKATKDNAVNLLFNLNNPKNINGIRYIPSIAQKDAKFNGFKDYANIGNIKSYEIYVKTTNNTNFELVKKGNIKVNHLPRRLEFPTIKNVEKVKLKITDSNGQYTRAAELHLTEDKNSNNETNNNSEKIKASEEYLDDFLNGNFKNNINDNQFTNNEIQNATQDYLNSFMFGN